MSDEQKPWWQSILVWLKDVLPTGLALIMAVYHYMKQRLLREEARHEKTKLENKYLENEISVTRDTDSKSNDDIIAEAISEGAELRRRKNGSD